MLGHNTAVNPFGYSAYGLIKCHARVTRGQRLSGQTAIELRLERFIQSSGQRSGFPDALIDSLKVFDSVKSDADFRRTVGHHLEEV